RRRVERPSVVARRTRARRAEEALQRRIAPGPTEDRRHELDSDLVTVAVLRDELIAALRDSVQEVVEPRVHHRIELARRSRERATERPRAVEAAVPALPRGPGEGEQLARRDTGRRRGRQATVEKLIGDALVLVEISLRLLPLRRGR